MARLALGRGSTWDEVAVWKQKARGWEGEVSVTVFGGMGDGMGGGWGRTAAVVALSCEVVVDGYGNPGFCVFSRGFLWLWYLCICTFLDCLPWWTCRWHEIGT